MSAENVAGLGVFTGPTFSSANPRSGSFNYRNTTASNGTQWTPTATFLLATTYFLRAYVYLSALPASASPSILGVGNAGPNLRIAVNPDGSLSVASGSTGATILASTAAGAVTAGSYFLVELSFQINSGASDDIWEGRLNGASFGSGTSTIATTAQTVAFFGGSDGTIVTDFDDLAVNDTTGAAQTSWAGSGKVILLKPISDSAVGTGWTLGTGTAIAGGSGSTAVKNIPPLGVADLAAGSDTKQIRNAASNANVNYDANLTTYTAAGVGASDTVKVLIPMVATAAPVVTSAKAGTIGVSANPVIANVALGAAGTAGAFWSGLAGGTFPTGWKWSAGTTTYAPTVTLGSSPVARITQVTASTRIADVCAMGLYMEYTPAAVVLPFNAAEGEEHSDPRSLQLMDRVPVFRSAYFCLGEKWARKGRLWLPAADRPFALA